MLRCTPEYAQFISKEVLARLNSILPPQYLHFHNIFSKSSEKSLNTDPEERSRKQWKETPQTSTSKKVLTSRQKDIHRLERRIFCFWSSQYSLLSACVRVPWCRGPNWFNSLQNRCKLNGKLVSFYRQIQKFLRCLFTTLIVSTFSTQELSFWWNNLGSISLTEIVLKL